MKKSVHLLGIMFTLAIFLVAHAAFSQKRNANPPSETTNPIQLGLKHTAQPARKAPASTILYEDFESATFPPSGWTTASPDGGTGWERGVVGGYAPGWYGFYVSSPMAGEGVAICTFQTGGFTISDQYLITPQLAITANQSLDFWIQRGANNYSDSVQVLVSTTDNQPTSFTNILKEYTFLANDNELNWKHHLLDLSAFAGQNIYIAFREHASQNYGTAIISIDEVSVLDTPTTPIYYLNYTSADFQLVDVGYPVTIDGFKLSNNGIGSLTASGVTFSNPAFSSSFEPAGIDVSPEGTYEFNVSYTPTATGFDEGTMTIETNGGTVVINLKGQGYKMPENIVQVGREKLIGLGIPMDQSWGYTYSQTIYKQSDINTGGKRITKVLYHYFHDPNEVSLEPYTDNIQIYMGHTSRTTLENWIPVTDLVEVYSGPITCPGDGDAWIELTLTFPFAYNNVDNLVVAFDENTPDAHAWSGEYFMCSKNENNDIVTLRKRAWDDIDPAQPLELIESNHIPYYPNIRFQVDPLSPEPVLVVFPRAIDFKYTEINKSKSAVLTFSNFGATDLHVTGVTGLSEPFNMDPVNLTIPAGGSSAPVIVTFRPTTEGDHFQNLVFTTDAVSGNNEIPVSGFCYPDPFIKDFPYEMGFEGTDPVFPAFGWKTTNEGSSPWMRGTAPYTGDYSAGVANWSLKVGEAFMTTPYIKLPEGYRITFWWADNDNQFPYKKSPIKSPSIVGYDTTYFEASLDKGLTWKKLATLSAKSVEQWHKEYVDLAGYASDSLLLRWRDVLLTADYYVSKGVALDDILIEYNNPVPQLTLNTDLWNAGRVLPGDVKKTDKIYTLTNTEGGILTVTSLDGLEGTDFSTTLVPADVNLGLGESYSFGFSYSPATVGADQVFFKINSNSNGGEETIISLQGEAVQIGEFSSESFDDEPFPPLGWIDTDADGDKVGWLQKTDPTSYAYSTHSGIGCAFSESFSLTNGGVLFPDNYLITPPFTVTDQKNQLIWWVSPHGIPGMEGDHYSVSISITGTDPLDFIELFSEDILFQDFNLRVLSLNDYIGKKARIAFRHYWSRDKWQVKIDDVAVVPEGTYTSVDEVSKDSDLNIYPNPARDIIKINSSDVIKRVDVYNTLGTVVNTKIANAANLQLNVSHLPQGMYIIKVETGNGVLTRHVNVIR